MEKKREKKKRETERKESESLSTTKNMHSEPYDDIADKLEISSRKISISHISAKISLFYEKYWIYKSYILYYWKYNMYRIIINYLKNVNIYI